MGRGCISGFNNYYYYLRKQSNCNENMIFVLSVMNPKGQQLQFLVQNSFKCKTANFFSLQSCKQESPDAS